MSVALSMVERLHHNLRLTFSPSYRQVRQRIETIAQPRA